MTQSISQQPPLSKTDLSLPLNKDQALFELRRALDIGDDAKLVVWARTWGEPAMRALTKP